ncbi:MAG: hypothetical protein IJX14_02055 [Clostridia bacterium]|nr:hypothetical protein [Clostridia bacterium]
MMKYLYQYFYSVLFYTLVTAGAVVLLYVCRNPLSALTTHFDPGKKAVRERIEGILDTSRKQQGWWLVVLVLAMCLFSGSFFSCQKQTDAPVSPHTETIQELPPTDPVHPEKPPVVWQDPIPAEKGRWYTVPEMPESILSLPDVSKDRISQAWSIGEPADPDCPLRIEGLCYANMYDKAEDSWICLQIYMEDTVSTAYLYVPFSAGYATESVSLVRETESVYSLYLSVFRGRDFYLRYTITAEEDGYTVSAPLETEYLTLVEIGAVDTKLYTAATLEEIRQYTDQGVWKEQVYDFLWNLLSGESGIPEYNTVKITDSKLTFAIPLEPIYSIWWDFTVTESGLDTLPPGTYHMMIRDIIDCFLVEPMSSEPMPAEDVYEEERMISRFIAATYIWNTPIYGEGTEYPGMHNYLCEYYGNGSIPAEEYVRLAKEKFGAEIRLEDVPMLYEEDGVLMTTAGGIGGNFSFTTIGSIREPDMTHVTVQFYADCNSLLPSHTIVYHITEDGVFHGYDILKESPYPPYGLRYLTDPYTAGSS